MLRRYSACALLLCSLIVPPGVVARAVVQQPSTPAQQTPAPRTPTPATPPTQAPAPQTPAQTPSQTPARDPNDPIERIKDESLNRSQVMRTLSYLTDVIGPRLTNSPNMKRANTWTRDKMTEWGLQNARLEPWGPFGRGWSLERFNATVVEPQSIPLIAFPKAWSPGTNGPLVGDVIYVDAKDEADLQRFKGKLKGAIVLTSPVREIKARFEAPGTRLTEKELLELANAPDPGSRPSRRFQLTAEQLVAVKFSAQKLQFFADEGAALLVDISRAGDGGTIFVQSAAVPQPFDPSPTSIFRPRIAAWDKTAPKITPQVVVAAEDYNRMARMIQQGEKIRMAVDLAVKFHEEDLMAYNTVAEIPGTDLKDEVVMLGGHMDSWHAGTGATDNAAGVAVAMEAVRILKALNLQPRRTIRVALWSGEEQGLYGSRAYVAEHFGTIGDGSANASMTAMMKGETPKLNAKPAHDKLSVYFNLDNGTGKIRGVYLQGNEAVRPIFRRWLAPFRAMGATTLSIANTGGTDHLSFDAVGLPGFQFIQDEIEYETRTHHSNQDVYDRIQADDMKQAAAIMAVFVYNSATMDEKLPRKPSAPNPSRGTSVSSTATN
ncbi:MAG: M20/M25/M40 family metallo-hydrolase [Pyrinomonadaceae bacterium]|nr:M20/M25/M40 family metallo-hydrolase [Pyrinomonadaceae bacterium]